MPVFYLQAILSSDVVTETNPLKTYPEFLERLRQNTQGDAALEAAVGGEFINIGRLERALLEHLRLRADHCVVDVGCGSGRLAAQLSPIAPLRYVGTDVVPDLLKHAAKITGRTDWKFVQTDGIEIPCENSSADFVCFFSVLTHLLHEDSFRYLREARRVLKPGGLIVLSFLEFQIYSHWTVFDHTVNQSRPGDPLNQFISRDAIAAWAHHLDLVVENIWDGDKPHIPIDEDIVWQDGQAMKQMGALGQSVAVLRKPAQ